MNSLLPLLYITFVLCNIPTQHQSPWPLELYHPTDLLGQGEEGTVHLCIVPDDPSHPPLARKTPNPRGWDGPETEQRYTDRIALFNKRQRKQAEISNDARRAVLATNTVNWVLDTYVMQKENSQHVELWMPAMTGSLESLQWQTEIINKYTLDHKPATPQPLRGLNEDSFPYRNLPDHLLTLTVRFQIARDIGAAVLSLTENGSNLIHGDLDLCNIVYQYQSQKKHCPGRIEIKLTDFRTDMTPAWNDYTRAVHLIEEILLPICSPSNGITQSKYNGLCRALQLNDSEINRKRLRKICRIIRRTGHR